MIAEVAAGGALGLALSVLHEAVKRAKDRSVTTRFILHRLEATIDSITPLVVQIDKFSEEMEDSTSRKVNKRLKLLLENAVSLVEENAELRRRNVRKKFRYMRDIKEFEAKLRWVVDVDVQVNQLADIKELKAKMSEISTKLDKIMPQPKFEIHIGWCSGKTNRAIRFTFCSDDS
ncbi:Powdery mildew resistance protein RPW8 domain [Arabidopsis suecica]|uniref:Protein RESISTANCE TO POWDERY MILDEW 8.2 n=3 Tax=Arabidopsis TaxID=3701 RepID=RPW82_ARATH|nr:RecName: Full=Protein RESISTANCE TO POWDERY MILDEW 8.2; Short=AtRPW8.2 [Arabidopsis thaliana]AAK09267.1 RPW8.2 [Arabidopsis thaliana]ACJ72022.1 RPW8.2 [Arabidopsis thaliana]KAG7633922.1 Powdery mildew resistance protein RPW8 domain [Arabidopsis suecica]CAD5325409.1 unnamed protein product [Arabidopsis thaliana]